MPRLLASYLAPFVCGTALFASDATTVPRMSMELANEIAKLSVLECRKMGYQVSAVVVDRNGNVQAALRDTFASRFTLEIARDKTGATIMSGLDSGSFVQNRQDIKDELNQVTGVLMLRGALPVKSGDVMLGAVGVSGAPGGEKDEACAQAALKAMKERLDFALFSDEDE